MGLKVERCLCPGWSWDHKVNVQLVSQLLIYWTCPWSHGIDRCGRGWMTSDLQEGDPKLETLSPLEFAGTCICRSIDECYTGRFPIVTGGRGSETSGHVASRSNWRGATGGKASTRGDVLASGCNSRQKEMRPNTQSIIGLKWVSQWYPSMIMQPWSNGVTKNVNFWISPVGKWIGRSNDWVMTELEIHPLIVTWLAECCVSEDSEYLRKSNWWMSQKIQNPFGMQEIH